MWILLFPGFCTESSRAMPRYRLYKMSRLLYLACYSYRCAVSSFHRYILPLNQKFLGIGFRWLLSSLHCVCLFWRSSENIPPMRNLYSLKRRGLPFGLEERSVFHCFIPDSAVLALDVTTNVVHVKFPKRLCSFSGTTGCHFSEHSLTIFNYCIKKSCMVYLRDLGN